MMLCKAFSPELKWIIKIKSGFIKLHVVKRPVGKQDNLNVKKGLKTRYNSARGKGLKGRRPGTNETIKT